MIYLINISCKDSRRQELEEGIDLLFLQNIQFIWMLKFFSVTYQCNVEILNVNKFTLQKQMQDLTLQPYSLHLDSKVINIILRKLVDA